MGNILPQCNAEEVTSETLSDFVVPCSPQSVLGYGEGVFTELIRPDSVDSCYSNQSTNTFRNACSQGVCVHLNVYHLNDNWQQSNQISKQLLGIGGAFHAGIEVHGVEWTYGGEGISCGDPRSHEVHVYHESILLGETNLSVMEVSDLINELGTEWQGDDHHMLEKNCCNFSDTLGHMLTGESIPEWVVRFPHIASQAAAHLDGVIDIKRFVCPPQSGDYSPMSDMSPMRR